MTDKPGRPIIFSYTRQQAFEDGFLIDVTDQGKAMNCRILVALTDRLYKGYVLPPEDLEGYSQNIAGRLTDVLSMAFCAARFVKTDPAW